MLSASISHLSDLSIQLKSWLHEIALPLWRTEGFHGEHRGFTEALDLAGKATDVPRRGRVHPRQIYCFAEAGLHGWAGDWQPAVTQGLQYFDRVYRLPDGFYGALASSDGKLIDAGFDLYNQAFAILAFCYAARVCPDRQQDMTQRASAMLVALKDKYAHSQAGFSEAVPMRLPLCSNPHMHLFEAALACEETEGFDQNAWQRLADEIAELCLSRFIDQESGGLREFFNEDWTPFDGDRGRIMEPGHQFEWAWLLARWAERRRNADALTCARRLFDIGEDHGICDRRNVAVMSLLDDFSIHDDLARLWPQTEWLKSAMRLAVLSEGADKARYLGSAVKAVQALEQFLEVKTPGLWRDKLKADGSFVEEDVPASSLYHILCAIYEFDDCLSRIPD